MKNYTVKNMESVDDDDVHLLSDSWKLWYWRSGGSVSTLDDWMDNLHGLCEFDSVEKFWRQVQRVDLIIFKCTHGHTYGRVFKPPFTVL